jgi:hypothetical protein
MKKTLLTILILFSVVATGHGQKIAVKTNALGWAAAVTTNIGAEVALSPKFTLSADAYYNPFKQWGSEMNRRSTWLWGVQPELKYWLCRKFYGHYIGLHGQYSEFDAGLFKNRYEGSYYGAGLSYGYSLPVAYRWRLDFSLGLGWQHWDRDVYRRVGTGLHGDDAISNWDNKEFVSDIHPADIFGVTKAAMSVVFIIR